MSILFGLRARGQSRDPLDTLKAAASETSGVVGATGALTDREIRLLGNVGIAQPGTNKKIRSHDIASTRQLSQSGRFADIPSSGGFTVLGKNLLGQEVARSNVTGRVGTVAGLIHKIDPTARSIGAGKDARSVFAADAARRPAKERRGGPTGTADGGGTKKKKAILGTDDILGA